MAPQKAAAGRPLTLRVAAPTTVITSPATEERKERVSEGVRKRERERDETVMGGGGGVVYTDEVTRLLIINS